MTIVTKQIIRLFSKQFIRFLDNVYYAHVVFDFANIVIFDYVLLLSELTNIMSDLLIILNAFLGT